MAKKYIDEILWIRGFYPLSYQYNLEKAVDELKQKNEKLIYDHTSYSILRYSIIFNDYFKGISNALVGVIGSSPLSKRELIELLIADLNRKELILSEDIKQAILSKGSLDTDMIPSLHISKKEFQNNSEPAWGLSDSMIDIANLNLVYLDKAPVEFNDGTEIDELSQVNTIQKLGKIGSIFNAIKQSYDRVIWGKGIIQYENSTVKLKSIHNNLMLDNVALTRLARNTFATTQCLDESIVKEYHLKRSGQIIKSIELNNDLVLKYQASPQKLTDSFTSFVAQVLTYYPFLHSENIAAFNNLRLIDLINLFSMLYDFVVALPMPKYDETVLNLAKFKLFNPKVRKNVLIEYFNKVSRYSHGQIIFFINLLVKNEDHNLYRYPVYSEGEYYYFAHSTIKKANILYLVDKWLEVGKCKLAERGVKFEKYIKKILINEKLNIFAKFDLIKQSNFFFIDSCNNKVGEEIDLVISTETTIIIAEIKCTTYPLEHKDFYTSFQIVKEAKNQVVRKAEFIENNWDHFENLLGSKGSKKIEKVIIVNFPHHAGKNVEGVPVLDFYLFLSYFKSGKLTSVIKEKGKGEKSTDILYYDSIRTFESNFETFCKEPTPIQDLLLRQKIEEFDVLPKDANPMIKAERVVFLEKN